MCARYLISGNRRFLRELQTDALTVLDAEIFLAVWESAADEERAQRRGVAPTV